MRPLFRPALALLLAALCVSSARAHFNILLPQAASARKGEAVTFLYRFGHPFEHEMFDAPRPAHLFVITPDGKRTDLSKSLEKLSVPAGGKNGRKVSAYDFRFTPEQRGDYTVILQTPPIWMEEDKEFIQDTVRVVLHVQAQKGWDTHVGVPFVMMPLTRPYGLQPGAVFQAQVISASPAPAPNGFPRSKRVAGALVEIERFNAERPAKLPPDEFRTLTAKTDPNGVVTASLPTSGWWSITAQRSAGQREHMGKAYPLRQRATLWVWVDEKLTTK